MPTDPAIPRPLSQDARQADALQQIRQQLRRIESKLRAAVGGGGGGGGGGGAPTGPAGGSLAGSYPNPTLAAGAVGAAEVAAAIKDPAAATAGLRSLGTGALQAASGSDARLSNSRTPLPHADTHKSGGTDTVRLDELAAPTDVTTLNATTAQHGLLRKLDGVATHYLDGAGGLTTPTLDALASPTGATGATATIGDTVAHTVQSAFAGDFLDGNIYQATEDGVFTKVSAYVQGNGSTTAFARMAIYEADGTGPRIFLTASAEVSIAAGAAAAWVDFTVSAPKVAGSYYQLAMWQKGTASPRWAAATLSATEYYRLSAYDSSANPPLAWDTSDAALGEASSGVGVGWKFSIYATYAQYSAALNGTSSAHGLLAKLPGDSRYVVTGDGKHRLPSVVTGDERVNARAAPFNVIGDNSTDNLAGLQAAVNASQYSMAGIAGADVARRIVQLPPGRIKLSGTVTLPSNVTFQGHNEAGTYLVPTFNTDLPVLDVPSEVQVTIRDLGIIQQDQNRGIRMVNGRASILFDSRHRIENVVVVQGAQALYIAGNLEVRIQNLACYRQTTQSSGTYDHVETPVWIGGTDHYINFVTVAQPMDGRGGGTVYGLRMGAANSRISNCKVFGGGHTSNDGWGFDVGGGRSQAADLECQDFAASSTAGGAFTIAGNVVSNLVADSCGGISFDVGTRCIASGLKATYRNGGSYHPDAVLRIDGTSQISIWVDGCARFFDAVGGDSPFGKLVVNGYEGRTYYVYGTEYTTDFTPDPWEGGQELPAIGGNFTINAPVVKRTQDTSTGTTVSHAVWPGMVLEFVFGCDSTPRTVTFDTVYKLIGGGTTIVLTASSTTVVKFRLNADGNWRESAARAIT